jgi:hypothetical protein
MQPRVLIVDAHPLTRDALATLLAGNDFDVVDITIDAELERRYRTRIPVVEVDGVERCRYVVDEDALRSAVGTRTG